MATEDIDAPTRLYQVEGVEVLAETAELRVSVFTFGPGQEIPWHSHSEIDDIFVCLAGRLRIEARDPAETVSLAPGERHTMPAGRLVCKPLDSAHLICRASPNSLFQTAAHLIAHDFWNGSRLCENA